MASASDLSLADVGVVKNLEAILRVEGPRVVHQLDGEVRYAVARAHEPFVVRVLTVTLRVERGVVSVRVEADRVFVSVADGEATVSEGGMTDVLIAGDLLRLPRLRVNVTHRGSPLPPPPPPAKRLRAGPPPPPPSGRLTRSNRIVPPMVELPRSDSGALTLRRPPPRR